MNSLTKRLAMLNRNSVKILINEIGLPEVSKKVLIMKYVDELTAQEISDSPEFNTYDVYTMQGIIAKARRDLNRLIDTQYELCSREVKRIIDIMSEFNVK